MKRILSLLLVMLALMDSVFAGGSNESAGTSDGIA